MMEGNGESAIVFDPSKSADQLLADGDSGSSCDQCRSQANVFSLAERNRPNRVSSFRRTPRAYAGTEVRPAAVAGNLLSF